MFFEFQGPPKKEKRRSMTFGTEKQICTRRLISEGSNGRCVSRPEASKIQSSGPNCVDGDVYTLERVIKFCKLQKKKCLMAGCWEPRKPLACWSSVGNVGMGASCRKTPGMVYKGQSNSHSPIAPASSALAGCWQLGFQPGEDEAGDSPGGFEAQGTD